MGMFDYMQKQHNEATKQEAQLHEQYAKDLLNKHGLADMTHYAIEKAGYRAEHSVTPGEGGGEVHQWKLYKLADTSPSYRIKRVVATEAIPSVGGSDE